MWIRDTPSLFGFWGILAAHAIGMALLVGGSTIISLRILGVARDLPLSPLKSLYGIIWVGFWIQMVTGGLLLLAYPTKSLTNWNFYVKIVLIIGAMALTYLMKKRVFADESLAETDMAAKGRALAVWSLVLWVGTVTAGRMLAYTYTHVMFPG